MRPALAAALVVDDEVVWTHAFGTTLDTPFHVASISKVVTAAGVLRLVEAGAIDLDADARDYLPSGSLRTRSDVPVTVRQLITHTAGLAPIGRTRARASCRTAPETTWVYGNHGYGIVQRIIEARTGTGFQKYMAAEVFDPLRMQESRYRSGRPPLAACGLWTSARDLCRFVAAILGESAWLSQSSRHELVSPQPFGDGDHPFMALGLRLKGAGSETLAHHGGSWRSSKAQLLVWPERRAGAVVMGYRHPVGPTTRAVASIVQPADADEPGYSRTPDWVEGRYHVNGPHAAPSAWFRLGREVRVSMLGSHLIARSRWGVFRRGRTLYPNGPDRFAYLEAGRPVDVAFRRRGDEVLLFVSSPIGMLTRR